MFFCPFFEFYTSEIKLCPSRLAGGHVEVWAIFAASVPLAFSLSVNVLNGTNIQRERERELKVVPSNLHVSGEIRRGYGPAGGLYMFVALVLTSVCLSDYFVIPPMRCRGL